MKVCKFLLCRKMHFLRFACAVLLAISLSACTFSHRTTSVSFALPAWPQDAGFPSLAYWHVYSTNGADCVVQSEIASISLEVSPITPVAIIAQPITKHGEREAAFFHPAGCVYPATNEITWQNGFAAATCMNLYNASSNEKVETARYLASFNWKKMCDSVLAKSNNTLYDPWKADMHAVCSSIAAHSFSVSLLAMKRTMEIEMAFLAQLATARGMHNAYFLPQYVPLYETQRASGKTVAKRGDVNSFLCTEQTIAVVMPPATGSVMTLEISAVPVYTGRK
ncbi:MAG: hypothetical protein IJR50_05510 [Treponema sp.]|nr:hypothetical protein [Treponema sp.]